MRVICSICNKPVDQPVGAINRALRKGAPLYCSKACFSIARRKNKTREQLKEQKRLYDQEYRAKNKDRLKIKKAAAYKADPPRERERAYRQAHMKRHVAYCRNPSYVAWKKKYDRAYRCKKSFGGYWEAASILLEIEDEIDSRATDYNIRCANGTLNKKLERGRSYERTIRR